MVGRGVWEGIVEGDRVGGVDWIGGGLSRE